MNRFSLQYGRWIAVAVLATVICFLLARKRPLADQPGPSAPVVERGAELPASNQRVVNLSNLLEDARPGIHEFAASADALKLYNFDPKIVDYDAQTNRNGRVWVVFGTPTHIVEVINGKLGKVLSGSESLTAPRDKDRTDRKNWYLCTGTWNEDAAVKETLATLARLNDQRMLSILKDGRHEVEAKPIPVRDPQGNVVQVTPFWRVHLYDANGKTPRVTAEFRMGPDGPVGLTEWFCW